jgi:hypothetical protein
MEMGFLMFRRKHHQVIGSILDLMNAPLLQAARCYFGGGTAISLLLGEFRESRDIDFLCSDHAGYRQIRELVFNKGLDALFSKKMTWARETRSDQYGVRSFIDVDGVKIKFEIIREARIDLIGTQQPGIAVPCLTNEDMYAEKLLANADRYADRSVMSRDVIDLMAMELRWGPIPKAAWHKACAAYGKSVQVSYDRARKLLNEDDQYFATCLESMAIDEATASKLKQSLRVGKRRRPGC